MPAQLPPLGHPPPAIGQPVAEGQTPPAGEWAAKVEIFRETVVDSHAGHEAASALDIEVRAEKAWLQFSQRYS